MKKIISIALLALAVIALPLSLVGCGNSKEAKLIGSWIAVQERNIYNDGTTTEPDAVEDAEPITFLKNHKCSANGEVIDGYSWRVEGDHYILREEYKNGTSKEFKLTIKDGKLILENQIKDNNYTVEVTYERVK